jgi:hypothetical protein
VIYTVPTGKELVVEYIGASIGANEPPTGAVSGHVFSASGGFLPLVFEGADRNFAASEAVHYVFQAGAVLSFLGTLDGAGSCLGAVSVGGYLQTSE